MKTIRNDKAIEYHYDVGNDFYRLWLDPNMVYSCALWNDNHRDENLEQAQKNKLQWHLNNAGLEKGDRLLDVGCGWGSLLKMHCDFNENNTAVGLTLSREQKKYCDDLKIAKAEVYLESWSDHKPQQKYDGIVSIGAFEHFANPTLKDKEKIELYRGFFALCYSWLNWKGRLSLQTIIYSKLLPKDQLSFFAQSVFPDSELPQLDEIQEAAYPFFDIVNIRLDGLNYAKTCDIWLSNLRNHKDKAISLYGHTTYHHYVKYLKYCVAGFYLKKIDLARLSMVPRKNLI